MSEYLDEAEIISRLKQSPRKRHIAIVYEPGVFPFTDKDGGVCIIVSDAKTRGRYPLVLDDDMPGRPIIGDYRLPPTKEKMYNFLYNDSFNPPLNWTWTMLLVYDENKNITIESLDGTPVSGWQWDQLKTVLGEDVTNMIRTRQEARI